MANIFRNKRTYIEACIIWNHLRVVPRQNSRADGMTKIVLIAAKPLFSWALILRHSQNSVHAWAHYAGARLQRHVPLPRMERVIHRAFPTCVFDDTHAFTRSFAHRVHSSPAKQTSLVHDQSFLTQKRRCIAVSNIPLPLIGPY